MKRAFRNLTSDLRLLMLSSAILLSTATAPALTDGNPYSTIVGRNTFALKPPPPPAGPVAPPAAPPPNVSLQGISTILGRAQALLKVKIAPKPPDAGKELSLVMDVGQREGDVEVLSIDPATGTVNLSNQGSPLTLNIKDADKPAAGPAIAVAAGLPGVPGANPNLLNTIPTQSLPPNMMPPNKSAGSGTSITPIGAGSAVPTRPLRGGTTPAGAAASNPAGGLTGSGNTQSSYQPPDSGLSLDEKMAVLAVQHKINETSPSAVPLPPMPTRYQIK